MAPLCQVNNLQKSLNKYLYRIIFYIFSNLQLYDNANFISQIFTDIKYLQILNGNDYERA